MKKIPLLISLIISLNISFAQSRFKFAHVSDTHIGSSNSEEDLIRTVHSINSDSTLKFVIISGDITDFGTDSAFQLAKTILDSLNKPWYIIPGNHDANWSESGTNSFKKIFGSETFRFEYGGYLFLGTVCGPNMRMSPGQVSRENIVWLDSTLAHLKNKNIPIIFVNHYPQDSSLNNWFDIIDLLKRRNTQLILCGHGHANHQFNFEGISGIMGRSNLRAKKPVGGYNVVTIQDGVVTYEERNPVTHEQKQWAQVKLYQHHFSADTTHYFRPSYAVNNLYKKVKTVWQFNDKSDIGSGAAIDKNLVIVSNSSGEVYALNLKNGEKAWSFFTKGKIYSTPAVANNLTVVASTDDNIYCLNATNGKLVWKFKTQKPIVANPLIKNGVVFIGAADGHFRAIELKSGNLKWDYFGVKGFVVTTPLFYKDNIYFGSWGTEFYALNAETGAPAWKWNNGSSNRMYSPAACFPVATDGKIFIVAPDRYMTVLDAENGKEIWRKKNDNEHVRESMGLSKDSSLVYAKTMEGTLIGVSTSLPDMQISWQSDVGLNYEIAPTAIVEDQNIIYVPSNSGIVVAVNRDGSVLWKHKISNCLITSIVPVSKNKVIATTMDGKVTCLQF
ncbi:MAG TPA: PQQ-binding-like beta-propeller repeat protein [Hanamia sp.]|nr:PQQ-binding-like beta-propeller repeat protein [Hanamia sp.]